MSRPIGDAADESYRAPSSLLGGMSGPARAALTRPSYWCAIGLVTVAYVAAGKAGIELSVAHGVITPVWAPTGISLAALLIFGFRLWPAVALGAFLANATSGVSPLVAAAIMIGNTLEALLGAYLLRKVGFRTDLGRVRDVLSLVILGAMVSTTVSATNGVTTLWLADQLPFASYDSEWILWWFGDAIGDLLVAPLLLVWAAEPARRLEGKKLLEGAVLLIVLTSLSWIIFAGGNWRYPYLLFPLLILATLRFKQVGAATSTFLVGAIAIWVTVEGRVPIGGASPTESVQILQALLAVVAISLLVLAATLAERGAAEEALEQAHANLAEAQEIAHFGSWEWNIASDTVTWSDELYRIYGLAPQSIDLRYESFLERVHRDDRRRVHERIEQAYADHQPFSFDHRIVLPDGGLRTLQGRGEVIVNQAGNPVRMVGTAQDITERRRLDDLREDILSAVSHELRTPLTSILGFSLTLKHKDTQLSQARVQELIGHIAQQATKLDRLLSDLLDLDRLRRGLTEATLRRTDIGRLVEDIAAAQAVNGHTIEVRAESVTAEVDASKIERIVENLLANAVKYSPIGTRISISVERHHEGVLIAVDDHGAGIPDEFKEAIFDVFNRGPSTLSHAPGTGIGLSLVSHFVELHGGRAWVEDNAGGGSSFRVLLPLKPNAPRRVPASREP